MAHSEAKFLHIQVKNIKKYDHAGNVSWAVYYIKQKKKYQNKIMQRFPVAVFQVEYKRKDLWRLIEVYQH